MTVGDLNPFRPTRWEHQRTGHHLIWFANTAEQLTDDKSVYVRGSRGSGKTTLLKSICWEDLTRNPSLKLQRKLTDFSYIGVYVRFPDHISASLSYSAWDRIYPLSPNPDLEMHRFFSLAVELVCLDRCLSACHELRVDGACYLLPSDESRIVHAIFDEFPALRNVGNVQYTFHSLARVCRTMVREMNQACARGTVAMINERLPVREPGELLKFATNQLAQSLELVGDDCEREIGFKFCLDDCEVLNPSQQRSLNTLVRTSEHPVSWVVSCVGSFFDTTETFIDQQPLTDHDRRIVMLDARDAAEFRSLCQAVLSLRLYFSVSDETRESYNGPISDFFVLESRLGRRDVNDLFESIIRTSKSPYARNVRDTAHALRIAMRRHSRRFRAKYPPKSTDYPYYEAYVLLLGNGDTDAFRTDFGPTDQQRVPLQVERFDTPAFEAWLRRKQAAALLHFAAKLGFRRIPFAGTPMITHLADGSVRDFLEIVGEIFDAYCKRHRIERNSLDALDRFATSRTLVGWPIQVSGIYSASTSYLSGISNRSELDASVITRFIDGLGQYTSELQSNPNDPTVLGRAERGIFTVRFKSQGPDPLDSETQASDDAVWNVIRQAELAGYIRTTEIRFGAGVAKKLAEQDARVISFRLHHRFAPHFRFSYRGAYEPVALAVDDLAVLLDRINQVDSKQWALRMASRRTDDTSQLRLELTRPADDE
jgi:GTPase SAR1 family protein